MIIHLCRKPLAADTVAANVLAHYVGAINVEDSRVAGVPRTTHKDGNFTAGKNTQEKGGMWASNQGGGRFSYKLNFSQVSVPTGRFPANMIVLHTPDCNMEGVKSVSVVGCTSNKAHHKRGVLFNMPTGQHGGFSQNGKESIPNWICTSTCPVHNLGIESRYFHQIK